MPTNATGTGGVQFGGSAGAVVYGPALITITRLLDNLNNRALTAAETVTCGDLINAVSAAIRRYCRTDFLLQNYDELYSGNGYQRLLLRQIPIVNIQSVRYGPYAVLRVFNNAYTTNQRATVAVTNPNDAAVTGSGLTLTRVASGVASTDTGCLFATYPTLQAVANYINGLGNGWQAYVPNNQYAQWPSADLRIQGALNCAQGTYGELKMHVIEMSDFQVDRKRGWIIRGINALVVQWDDPMAVWTPGIDNYRVQYQAGYSQIPNDVQEACAEWTAALFWQCKGNPVAVPPTPPPHVALILDHYRQVHPMPI
jgi:hypothetical protein